METNIYWLARDEAYDKMYDICLKIYGARNIWMSNNDILDQLKRIDQLFRTKNYTDWDEQKVLLLDECATEMLWID